MTALGQEAPELAALDAWVDAELCPPPKLPECGSRLSRFGMETEVCRLPAGHAGVCGWAMTAPARGGEGER